MLFFELFPAFMTAVSLLVGIALFVANRRAGNEPRWKAHRPAPPAGASEAASQGRQLRRPSMSA